MEVVLAILELINLAVFPIVSEKSVNSTSSRHLLGLASLALFGLVVMECREVTCEGYDCVLPITKQQAHLHGALVNEEKSSPKNFLLRKTLMVTNVCLILIGTAFSSLYFMGFT